MRLIFFIGLWDVEWHGLEHAYGDAEDILGEIALNILLCFSLRMLCTFAGIARSHVFFPE